MPSVLLPVKGEFKDVCSGAIAGLMGSGKTTTACFIAAQVVLKGGLLIVIDPHGNASLTARKETLSYNLEPLIDHYAINVAIEDEDILSSVMWLNRLLDKRKHTKSNEDDLQHVMLFLDEFSSVMRNSIVADELSLLLENVATEGRKFRVGAMLLGQQWHVKRSGGGPLRDVLGSAFVHRIKRKVARMLIDDVDETSTLADGEAWLYRSQHGTTRVRIPFTTRADLIAVASLLKSGEESAAKLDRNLVSAGNGHVKADLPKDPITQAVIDQFLGGTDIRQIIVDVYRVKSGTPYNRAFAEVNEILREFILSNVNVSGVR